MAENTPEWCGQCDRKKRELITPQGPKRCPACHPLGRQPLAQFRICPDCNSTLYKWDRSDCENHLAIRQITGAA